MILNLIFETMTTTATTTHYITLFFRICKQTNSESSMQRIKIVRANNTHSPISMNFIANNKYLSAYPFFSRVFKHRPQNSSQTKSTMTMCNFLHGCEWQQTFDKDHIHHFKQHPNNRWVSWFVFGIIFFLRLISMNIVQM